MSLDTKYRPLRYADVLGQDATVQICKELVRKGYGFRQSYVFAGPWGSGKTTLGRILARALLCENPQDGEPCDLCHPCRSMLEDRSESFVEVDAATNSGKEDIKRITEEARYGSFSGRRKLYLLDECHQLSRQSMDALLKPLEDNIRGSRDKQLVCIFCTTEPEKMRSAIVSRCAPVFRIKTNTPMEIAARLASICDAESLEYEQDALQLITEITECHIRDAIKAVEGISMLGKVDRANAAAYLRVDANALYVDLLDRIGSDLAGALQVLAELAEKVSPSTCYERLADLCMLMYRLVNVGHGPVPSYWNRETLNRVGEQHREFLLVFAERFAQRPHNATSSMLMCDVGSLHHQRQGVTLSAPGVGSLIEVGSVEAVTPTRGGQKQDATVHTTDESVSSDKVGVKPGSVQEPCVTPTGVYLDPLGELPRRQAQADGSRASSGEGISAALYAEIVKHRVAELERGRKHHWQTGVTESPG